MLVRADLNVPLDKNQKITDDTRIRAAIPTLKYLTESGAKVLLTSHLVRGAFKICFTGVAVQLHIACWGSCWQIAPNSCRHLNH